jgi:serine/threonine-protein kinase
VSVRGLVVLARGKAAFENRSSFEEQTIVGIDQALLKVVNPPAFLLKPGHRMLTDEEIENIKNNLYKKHIDSGEILIEDFRLGNKLLPGDLYKAYEAVNQNLPSQRVRVKVYQQKSLAGASERTKLRIRRDADAVSKLGVHRNILYTLNFFPDPERSDLYYQVTELIDGDRLDEMMSIRKEPLPFRIQLDYLEQLCDALAHAHQQGVYHRNICPETVYVTTMGVIKLADFDFAKVEGSATIIDPKEPLTDTEFTAPELTFNASNASPASDLYSLGVMWLYMASWPEKKPIREHSLLESLLIPENARKLIKSLIAPAPANRPQNAEEVRKKLVALRDAT